MSCNFAIHATCLLALTTYKYSELQMSFATQKLNGVINKMHFLVYGQCEKVFEHVQNVIIEKINDNYCHVCSQNLSLHPFGNVTIYDDCL